MPADIAGAARLFKAGSGAGRKIAAHHLVPPFKGRIKIAGRAARCGTIKLGFALRLR
jgi:hypothetical protein